MADKSKEEPKLEEATVGLKTDLKTHLILSSSAKAVKDQRDELKRQKALNAFQEGNKKDLERKDEQGSSKGSK